VKRGSRTRAFGACATLHPCVCAKCPWADLVVCWAHVLGCMGAHGSGRLRAPAQGRSAPPSPQIHSTASWAPLQTTHGRATGRRAARRASVRGARVLIGPRAATGAPQAAHAVSWAAGGAVGPRSWEQTLATPAGGVCGPQLPGNPAPSLQVAAHAAGGRLQGRGGAGPAPGETHKPHGTAVLALLPAAHAARTSTCTCRY
jgi:hypothetical protein